LKAPREIGPGVWWLGDCIEHATAGTSIHLHFSAFLVVGGRRTLLYDTGYPAHWPAIEAQLAEVLDDRELDYVVVSHPELPHAGNLGRLLALYPASTAVGDVRDLHLFHPGIDRRLKPQQAGDELDLGGRRFHFLPALLHDLGNTIWGYDDLSRTLFACDGFIYAHNRASAAAGEPVHDATECRLLVSELPERPRTPEAFRMSAEGLYWTRRRDPASVFDRFDALLARFGPTLIAPTHGNPIDGDLTAISRLAREAHQQVFLSSR
jgi:glyoxylase-like metal-dependent hydrolase (beta-lactamase superfamily II)